MFTLVIGGAASGKSEYAEALILRSPASPRIYLATMQPFDGECTARIARHRRMRAAKRFETVECYRNLAALRLPRPGGAVLLECLSNLAANELFTPGGMAPPETALAALLDGVDALLPQCRDLVVVSNEVFAGGSGYAGETDAWLRLLAAANRALARRADNLAEVVCGLPVYHKGGEP